VGLPGHPTSPPPFQDGSCQHPNTSGFVTIDEEVSDRHARSSLYFGLGYFLLVNLKGWNRAHNSRKMGGGGNH
jgi:hypothetical protein